MHEREKNEGPTHVEDTVGQGSHYSFSFLFSAVYQVKCFTDTLHSEIIKIKSTWTMLQAFQQFEEMYTFVFLFLEDSEKIVILRQRCLI